MKVASHMFQCTSHGRFFVDAETPAIMLCRDRAEKVLDLPAGCHRFILELWDHPHDSAVFRIKMLAYYKFFQIDENKDDLQELYRFTAIALRTHMVNARRQVLWVTIMADPPGAKGEK